MALASQTDCVIPGKYRVGPTTTTELSGRELAGFVADTNAMLRKGLHVPVWKQHKPINSIEGGPQFSRDDIDSTDSVGWLKGVSLGPNGGISWEAEITDSEAARKIEEGSIRFSSPELKWDYVDGRDRNHGNVIRHLALTPTPRNPDQGEMVIAMSGDGESIDCLQLSYRDLDSYNPYDDDDDDETGDYYPDDSGDFAGGGDGMDAYDLPTQEPHPGSQSYMSPVAGGSELEQLAADLQQELENCDISAPTANPSKDLKGWLAQLFVALRQKNKAEAKRAAQEAKAMAQDPFNGLREEQNFTSQYSEDGAVAKITTDKAGNQTPDDLDKLVVQFGELAESDPHVAGLIKLAAKYRDEAQQRTAQFSEKQQTDSRAVMAQEIEKLRNIPPGLRAKLIGMTNSVQFSESGTTKVMDPLEIGKLVAQFSLPVEFEGSAAEQQLHGDGESFYSEGQVTAGSAPISDADAEQIATELEQKYHRTIHGDRQLAPDAVV